MRKTTTVMIALGALFGLALGANAEEALVSVEGIEPDATVTIKADDAGPSPKVILSESGKANVEVDVELGVEHLVIVVGDGWRKAFDFTPVDPVTTVDMSGVPKQSTER